MKYLSGKRVVEAVAIVLAMAIWAAGVGAQTLAPLEYTVRFPSPSSHYAEIEVVVPTDGQSTVELMMAVWTPGSYLVREYAQHVESVTAVTSDGRTLAIEKSRKNRWRVESPGLDRFTVNYRVYCRDMSVRTNWVESDFAMLNGAPTFLTVADSQPRPHDIRLELAPGWTESVTGLPPGEGGLNHTYRAADFDTLVDSPIVLGNPATYAFAVEGIQHKLVNIGEGGIWDGSMSATHIENIVREGYETWGFFPYERFLFINMLTEAGGGLEHKNSTLLMGSRWTTRDRRRYLRWLETASHELFHAWNVKQLRPIALGPFDYEQEVLTPSLWMVEGLTSYYGTLMVHRAGISTREEFFDSLSETIEELQTTPGRLSQSAAESSFDAWIKYYRRNENSLNSSISYYTKGAVIGFLLDARIRQATQGRRSLDDAMRNAYEQYSDDQGFRPEEFEAIAAEVAGIELLNWFDRAVRSTDELDYEEALGWYGLAFKADEREDVPAWVGLNTRIDRTGRLVVTRVPRETPGYDAGFNVDDEIVGIDEYRVNPEDWSQRLGLYKPGDTVRVLVARREQLLELDVQFGEEPADEWKLVPIEEASAEQKRNLDAWLGSDRGVR